MLLTVIEVVFVGLFVYGLMSAWASTEFGNMYTGALLAMIFIDLAFILLLYRKEFLPDVMIVKKRRRKWEDLYIREEDKDGTGIDTDGAMDTVKRAVYPYYKK